MAEHLLDVADVGSVFEHEGGHGVPEDVGRSFFQSGDGSKGSTEGKPNEANFEHGSFTPDGMRYE